MDNHLKFIDKQKENTTLTFYGEKIAVVDGVYHPIEGSSTQFVADALFRIAKPHHSLLEIGCGSGAISCIAASKIGMDRVMAADVSILAYDCTKSNVSNLDLHHKVEVIKSDLFEQIPEQMFDLVVFNPPLLHCEPLSKSLAEKEEYNEIAIDYQGAITLKFIKDVKKYIKQGSTVLMVISNIGNKEIIKKITEDLHEIGEVSAASAMYRQAGEAWRFVLSVSS